MVAYNLFEPPVPTQYNFISLGAGVQSSTLALMAAQGEFDVMPDAAIFADTQSEPSSVYKWLDWLENELPFPVHRVTQGDMAKVALTVRKRSKGVGYWTKSLVPGYTLDANGNKGHMQRLCTYDYKLIALWKAQRRLAKVKRGQKTCSVTSWIGISWDEIVRMKESNKPWVQHRHPLIERRMTRQHCLDWMHARGYPKPPRSSCVFCPYHSNAEWRRLRDEEPAEFARAVKFERDLQQVKTHTDNLRGVIYLHPSRVPLDQANFKDADPNQTEFGWQSFGNECEGMCGV